MERDAARFHRAGISSRTTLQTLPADCGDIFAMRTGVSGQAVILLLFIYYVLPMRGADGSGGQGGALGL